MSSPHWLARRQRLLIIGCGDVGERLLKQLALAQNKAPRRPRLRVYALTSSPHRLPHLRQLGALPLLGNLDAPASLRRLAALGQRLLFLTPPAAHNLPLPPALLAPGMALAQHPAQSLARHDGRSWATRLALGRSRPLQRMVYASTTGVYGNQQGAWLSESAKPQAQSTRAQRRLGAELLWRRSPQRASILRIPGIYALDRPNGTPATRLQAGRPLPLPTEDVYTSHIHADDLARACWLALWRGRPQRIYHVCDDSAMKMGDYFELAAQLLDLPAPPRLPRAELAQALSPAQMSFLQESRRLHNQRLKNELGLRLRYPHPAQGLQAPSPLSKEKQN